MDAKLKTSIERLRARYAEIEKNKHKIIVIDIIKEQKKHDSMVICKAINMNGTKCKILCKHGETVCKKHSKKK
tara:strand:- start:164 stop:382 length:219 start_codon:yes stop_codon:yes gene_type:complete